MYQVSVCIFSFNHEKYISRTIDSILSQKTNFNFEIIVGDDFSKDSTRSILNNYQYNYPEIITLNYNKENLGSIFNLKSELQNFIFQADRDASKIQKQFLIVF